MPASFAASSKLVKLRVTPFRYGTLNENDTLVPKIESSTVAPAELRVAWPAAYSGKAGVISNGVQPGSEIAAELTALASCTAWIGRQVP